MDNLPEHANAALSDYVQLEHTTSQKRTLTVMKEQPPHVLFVEMSAQPNSRADFLRTVRYRYPKLAVVAVSEAARRGQFLFDEWIPLPLVPQQVEKIVVELKERISGHWVGHGPLQLNTSTREVKMSHGTVRLKPKEAALLHLLIERCDQDVTRVEIMQEIWDTSYMADTRTLDVHIRWLREKVEADPAHPVLLVTVRNVGYRLNLSEVDPG